MGLKRGEKVEVFGQTFYVKNDCSVGVLLSLTADPLNGDVYLYGGSPARGMLKRALPPLERGDVVRVRKSGGEYIVIINDPEPDRDGDIDVSSPYYGYVKPDEVAEVVMKQPKN
jgi:hypothetical protein